MLNRDQILKANDLKTETVAVPEWGGEVLVRMMTGTARDKFEEQTFFAGRKKGGKTEVSFDNIRARLVAAVLVDEEGNLLFSPSDIAELGKKSAAALDRIFTVAQKLNGFTKEDIDELAKNSETDLEDDSISS